MKDARIVIGLDEQLYHARPELSSTEARMILRTPAEYRWHKDHPPLIAPSKKFDIGSAIHSKVLGTGYEVDVIPDDILAVNGAASTTAAKAFIADSRAANRIPMKLVDFEAIDGPAEAVLANTASRQLLTQPGHAEVSVFATDPDTGVEVRARFDFLPNLSDGLRVGVDLKSTRDASPKGFARSIGEYNYDVQRAWYLDALRWATDQPAEMVFIAVEKEPPFLTAVYQLPTIWAEMGKTKARRARELYAASMASGVWAGYDPTVQLLSPPNYLIYQFEEDYPND